MPTVAQILSSQMDPHVREVIERRTGFMVRRLKYLQQQNDRRLADVERAGWTVRRLEVVCWLNSFFQIVVSPLAASAVPGFPLDLGGATPITHGSITFDSERRATIGFMDHAFFAACVASGINRPMLTAHRADDLIYLLARHL